MQREYRSYAGVLLILAASSVLLSSSCGGGEQAEPEPPVETKASPEMVAKVDELEAEIRKVKEEQGEAEACRVVEEAEQMIFMATEVAWLHRNPGPELRPAYRKALASGTPMTEVFDYEAGEGMLARRYEEWDTHDRRMAGLKQQMATTVSGERCVKSLDAICAISETNPHGFALVSDTLKGLSGEMRCGG